MEQAFWHERWSKRQTAFHEGRPNRLLVARLDELALSPGSRLFLPLCGKTVDIHWLLGSGFGVAGIDLSRIAIGQLFDELGVEPSVTTIATQTGELIRYTADSIEIFVGDIFALDATTLGAIDAVYDRAALVALPSEMRGRYAEHLAAITDDAPQLLINFEYDQALFDGPPFSVPEAEIVRVHGARFDRRLLVREPVPGGLKGQEAVEEAAWLLTAKR